MSATSAAVLSDSTMIKVVGHEAPYPYGKVKDAVLYIGKEFYFKHDTENLVRVKDPSGKKKYFRRQSKLIHEISPGKFVHKSFLVRTDDGIFLDKTDPNTVIVDGKPVKKDFTVEINGTLYLRSNPNLQQCAITSKPCLKQDMVVLNPKYYNKNVWVAKNAPGLIEVEGGPIMSQDARQMLDKSGKEITVHRKDINLPVVSVFHKFRDATNPQLDRIDMISMFSSDAEETVVHPDLGFRIHKAHFDQFEKIYNDVILMRQAEETAAIKKALKYSDDGPDENQAKVVKKIPQPWPGKYNIYTPEDMSATLSKRYSSTGGLKYTFGVEIETAQGLVTNATAQKLKLRIVGDRSIGAGEYVTGVLGGNAGIELLEKQCRAISKYCFVDDKCGLHVHIKGEEPFDRHFCQYIIQLCCQIEPEIFAICPPSRQPMLKHCHSIMRWKDIDDKNWREYLGAFVHGPEENWNHPWSFAPYTYGKGEYTKSRKLGDFCGGRYKWLNLVHILSKSNIGTCELRIFPGTTNFDKIYNYVLISMAIVWFAENKIDRIVKGGVTLNEIFTTAFMRYPETAIRLAEFCQARKARFNRKNLYPSSIPKAIF